MQKIKITIPEPCHENWEQMSPVEKGRFCVSCQKKVFDFTGSTDRDIINAYQSERKLCGRFLKTQLDRDLSIPKEKKSIWLASVFFGIISLANTKIIAQEKPKTEQSNTEPYIIGKIIDPKLNQIEVKTITGIVSDATGPLPGVSVILKGTQKGVSTNFSGEYSIQAKEGDSLVFSFLGMEEVTKVIGNSNIINTVLIDSERILAGEIVCISKKRTFFGRQFHKIGNWFRKKE
jgi:CarboxypepD_reg-like domain